jgi:hypothetical protein
LRLGFLIVRSPHILFPSLKEFVIMAQKLSIKPQKLSVALFASAAAITSQLFVALPARAECEYENTTYATGSIVGPLVCMPDGTWQLND